MLNNETYDKSVKYISIFEVYFEILKNITDLPIVKFKLAIYLDRRTTFRIPTKLGLKLFSNETNSLFKVGKGTMVSSVKW